MRRLLLAAAAVTLLAAACGDDSTSATAGSELGTTPPVPATAPVTTTTGVIETTTSAAPTTTESFKIQVARAMLDTWNDGDVDGFFDFFTEDGQFILWPAAADHVRRGSDFWAVLGDTTVMGECEEWADGRVRCEATSSNDLTRRVGIVTELRRSIWVDEDGRVTKYTALLLNRSDEYFMRDMAWWLETAHPELWESTFAIAENCRYDDGFDCMDNWRANAATAVVLLEHVDEFVEQSDRYDLVE